MVEGSVCVLPLAKDGTRAAVHSSELLLRLCHHTENTKWGTRRGEAKEWRVQAVDPPRAVGEGSPSLPTSQRELLCQEVSLSENHDTQIQAKIS